MLRITTPRRTITIREPWATRCLYTVIATLCIITWVWIS